MTLAWISFLDAALALALVAAGPLGAHLGVTAPFLGFQLFLFGLLMGILAAVLGLIGLLRTRGDSSNPQRNRAIVGLSIGGALTLLAVVIVSRSIGYPPINDITTDTENVPEFVKAGEIPANRGRDLKYDKAKYAERQKQGYGDLGALPMRGHPSEIFERVRATAESVPNWKITYSDSGSGTIEGVATSSLFGFQDDFVIQIRSDGSMSTVQMRSKSRDGVGDLGANAARIRSFFNRLSGESEGE